MKRRFNRHSVIATMVLVALGGMGGCDGAEEVLENTDHGLTGQVAALVADAVSAVGSITDVASAEEALPTLKDVDSNLGKLAQKGAELAPDLRDELTGIVTTAVPQLEEAICKISSLDGVGKVVGPTLSSLQSKLKTMMANDADSGATMKG